MLHREAGIAVVAVDRQELYRQVWSIPGSQLAVQYGISDVGLAKVCKRYRIPRPPRGYWARLRAGQSVRKAPLPKIADERYEVVYLKGWDMPDEALQHLIKEVDSRRGPSPAPADPEPPHRLVERAREQLAVSKPDPDGLQRTDPASSPDVRVSAASVERALDILNRLIRQWEGKRGEIRPESEGLGGKPATAIAIGPDAFYFRMEESLDDSKPVTDPARHTGRLGIQILGDEPRQLRRHWYDTKSQRLERLIGALVETLSQALEVKKRERLDAECIARQQEKVKAKRKAAAQVETDDYYRWQDLMQAAKRWRDAEDLRGYLGALKKAFDSGEFVCRDERSFREWFEWAVNYADSIDPVVGRQMPGHEQEKPKNVPIAELDMTSHTRAAVTRLGAADAEQLWRIPEDQVREASVGRYGSIWNEISCILEVLGTTSRNGRFYLRTCNSVPCAQSNHAGQPSFDSEVPDGACCILHRALRTCDGRMSIRRHTIIANH